MPFQATCLDCSKRFRVPHDQKTWTCKACGGELELAELEQQAGVECGQCGAELDPEQHFCPDCGAPSGGGEQHVAKRVDRDERRANAAVHHGVRALKSLSIYLKVGLFFDVLTLIFLVGVLLFADAPITALQIGILVFVAVEVGLLAYIIRQLLRRPFPAALTIALLRTVSLFLGFFAMEGSFSGRLLRLTIPILFTALMWHITQLAARITKLMNENPELRALKLMRGESPGGELSDETTSRRKRRARRQSFGTVKTVVGFVGILMLVLVGLQSRHFLGPMISNLFKSTPAEVVPERAPDGLVADFRHAWNNQNFEGMASFGKPRLQAKWIRSFERLDKRYGWQGEWPEIFDQAVELDGTRARVEYDTEAGILPVSMGYSGEEGWHVRSISFKQVQYWKD